MSELTLEKELYDSFGEEERLLLCSLIHDNVTCSVVEGIFSPQARLACRHCGGRDSCIAGPCMKKGKTAFYSKAAQKITEVRTGRFCKKDLQAKIRQQCHCTDRRIVTELPSRISAHGCGTNCTSLLKRIWGLSLLPSIDPSRAFFFRQVLQFSPYRGPSLQVAEPPGGCLWRGMERPLLLCHARRPDFRRVFTGVGQLESRASERDRSRQKAVE